MKEIFLYTSIVKSLYDFKNMSISQFGDKSMQSFGKPKYSNGSIRNIVALCANCPTVAKKANNIPFDSALSDDGGRKTDTIKCQERCQMDRLNKIIKTKSQQHRNSSVNNDWQIIRRMASIHTFLRKVSCGGNIASLNALLGE